MKNKNLILVIAGIILLAFAMTFSSCTTGSGTDRLADAQHTIELSHMRQYKVRNLGDRAVRLVYLQRGFISGDTTKFYVGQLSTNVVIVDTLN